MARCDAVDSGKRAGAVKVCCRVSNDGWKSEKPKSVMEEGAVCTTAQSNIRGHNVFLRLFRPNNLHSKGTLRESVESQAGTSPVLRSAGKFNRFAGSKIGTNIAGQFCLDQNKWATDARRRLRGRSDAALQATLSGDNPGVAYNPGDNIDPLRQIDELVERAAALCRVVRRYFTISKYSR
jgi:hypothetical protein